jgi:hypothetical protein
MTEVMDTLLEEVSDDTCLPLLACWASCKPAQL